MSYFWRHVNQYGKNLLPAQQAKYLTTFQLARQKLMDILEMATSTRSNVRVSINKTDDRTR